MFRIILSLFLLLSVPVYSQNRIRITIPTVSQLATRPPFTNEVIEVLGYSALGDWGPPKLFRWDRTNTLATNAIRIKSALAVGRYIHDWDGDVRAFGAIPYHPIYSLMPWGYQTESSPLGTNDFSVYIRATLPSVYNSVQGLFEIGPASTVTNAPFEGISSIGMRASPTAWGFVFRSTSGGSGAGTNVDGAAVLESSPAALAAYAGSTVDIVLTRANTNAAVYFNGTNVTSLFTLSNPDGWAKALGGGSNLLYQVGNNLNLWYWSKPVHRFAFWASALTAGQAANPSAVGSKIVDYTPTDTAEPADLTANANAASDYNQSRGGGRIYFPSGVYRIGGSVRVGRQTRIVGDGTAIYPGAIRRAHRPTATTIFQWIDATNATFVGEKSQGIGTFLVPTAIVGATPGKVSSTWLRSGIEKLTIAGTFGSADAIVWDRVGSVDVTEVGFYNVPGYDIRAYAGNAVYIVNCTSANSGRSIDIRGCADAKVLGCFFDSGKGPILRWICNLSTIANSTMEVSQNPRTPVPTYEMETTVDPTTDVFTVTSSFGHLLNAGTPVRFDADSTNTLPGPLNENTDYYAIPITRTTFKVSTQLVAEDTQTGALFNNNSLDITNSGSGTWYSGVGPSVNIHLSGDHNTVIGNHGQQGWEGGLLLDGTDRVTKNNSIIGNQWSLTGSGNTDTNNVGAVRMINASQNAFIGNQLDDRDLSGYSQNGVLSDALSISNAFIGNSFNVEYPYDANTVANNSILDGNYSMFRMSEILLKDGASTNIYYAIVGNNRSDYIQWKAEFGTLTATNTGAGAQYVKYVGPYVTDAVYGRSDSTSADQGFHYTAARNFTNVLGSYQPLPAYTKIGGYRFRGQAGFNPQDTIVGGEVSTWTSSIGWNLTNAHSQMHFAIVGPNSAALRSAMILQFPAAGATNKTPIIISRWDGTNWLDAPQGWEVTLGTNDSGGSGKRVLLVPNN